jgi:hypothetical protein
VHGAGWGWLGGGGAREREWARLGTKRDAERDARAHLVRRAERRGGSRGGLSRSLSRAGLWERAGFHPRG